MVHDSSRLGLTIFQDWPGLHWNRYHCVWQANHSTPRWSSENGLLMAINNPARKMKHININITHRNQFCRSFNQAKYIVTVAESSPLIYWSLKVWCICLEVHLCWRKGGGGENLLEQLQSELTTLFSTALDLWVNKLHLELGCRAECLGYN